MITLRVVFHVAFLLSITYANGIRYAWLTGKIIFYMDTFLKNVNCIKHGLDFILTFMEIYFHYDR